ncbi:MAG: hypothetical protein Q4C98_09540 [Capnocytophaga sp.]|nr:hypothetical protein [Capnocytophaga sp.]
MLSCCKKEEKWLSFGKNHQIKAVFKNEKKYIVEEVSFETSKDSVHHIYLIVNELLLRKGLLETKYDWYDWSSNFLKYEDVTVRLFRFGEKIRLVRSTFPISIEEFEIESSQLF